MKYKTFAELKLEFVRSLVARLDLCTNKAQQYNVITISIDDFQKELSKNKLLKDGHA